MTASHASLLAQPITLRGRRLRNRVIGAPMERNLSTIDGVVTPAYIDYLEARARGGTALLYTEASYVRADGKGRLRQMGIHDDHVIDALSQLTSAVHRHGGLLGVELNHGGRTSQAVISGFRCVAPSPVPCEVMGGEVPIELEDEEIRHLISCYADGARRCVEAGVDVLNIHAAHGYLIHQFMSPRTNLRDDQWADPTRFLNEVILAVREAAPNTAIGMRISATEGPEDGLDADATLMLIGQASLNHLDYLDISAGSYEAGEWIVQPGEWAEGVLAPLAEPYRRFGLPVSVAGRITRRDTAEAVLANGQADMVVVARALHADPQWTEAVLDDRRFRPCISCNLCIDELGTGEQVPCSVNPDIGHELDTKPVTFKRHTRVGIVGGGPAGLEAARRLAAAGAEVTLWERETTLGGQFRLASGLHEYPGYHRILDWYEEELVELGVDVQLKTEADADMIMASNPDAVVVATGGTGVLPKIPGIDQPRVIEVRDWLLAGSPDLGDQPHVVWGADREGVAVADELAHRGKYVRIIGAQEALAPDVGRRAKILVVPRLTQHPDVELHLEARVQEIGETTLVIVRGDDRTVLQAPGPVLVSQGVTPRSGLASALRRAGCTGRIEVIGDAGGNGAYIARATADGASAACRLQDDTSGKVES